MAHIKHKIKSQRDKMAYKQQIAEWRKINNTFVLNRKEEGF